jgi:hypothetical protein
MRLSSRFLSNLTLVFSSIALLLSGPGGTAMAAADPSGSSSLPSITVEAPKPVARPHRTVPRAVARPAPRARHTRTVSRETSPAPTTQPGGQGSVLERLKRLERTSHGCDERCLKIRSQPGCSESSWPQTSVGVGCGNRRHFTHYVQCTDHLYFLGWKPREGWWYCTSLALNK